MVKGGSQQTFSFQDSGAPPGGPKNNSRKSRGGGGAGGGKKKKSLGSLGQKLESHFQKESGHHQNRDPIQQRHFSMGGGGGGGGGGERENEEKSVADQSLTYSASSSMGGSSNAGESTDSSFADIMKVLDLDVDSSSAEIAALMAREGVTDMSAKEYVQNVQAQAQARKSFGGRGKGSEASVAGNSLAYSEDGESTIADAAYCRYGGGIPSGNPMHSGQPSDSHGPDGGGFGGSDGVALARTGTAESDLVSPSRVHESKKAAHKPKSESMREIAARGGGSKAAAKKKPSAAMTTTPDKKGKAKGTGKHETSRSSTPDTSASSGGVPPSSPPPRAKQARRKQTRDRGAEGGGGGENTEAWYSQWWMCGFSDALRDAVGSFAGGDNDK